jgi:hypothetical protein
MKKILLASVLLLLFLMAGGTGCILDTKIVEIVISDWACVTFNEVHTSVSNNPADTLDYAEQLDQLLADNEMTRSDIKSAHIVRATYEITEVTSTGSFNISGMIRVARDDISDGPEVIVNYDNQDVSTSEIGIVYNAPLNGAGVALLDRALADYLAGTHNPTLIFTTEQGTIVPTPTDLLPLLFKWQGCILFQFTFDEEFEFPDPIPES